jgi:hypothetical protein
MGEMKKVGRQFGSATRARRRAVDGGARVAMWPEGRRCRWEPEVGDDALVGHTGLKGRATKWVESKGGYSINFFFNFKQDFRLKKSKV